VEPKTSLVEISLLSIGVAVIPNLLASGRAVKIHFANPYFSSNCSSLIEKRGFSPLHER